MMVVERQQFSSDGISPEHQCRNGNTKKVRTPTEIYRPPAARKLDSLKSTSEATSPDFTPLDVMSIPSRSERSRTGPKHRRPDIQVYVPRAKRGSISEQDSTLKSDSFSPSLPSHEPKRSVSGTPCKAPNSTIHSSDDGRCRFSVGAKEFRNAAVEHEKESKDNFGTLIPVLENSESCSRKTKELPIREEKDLRSADSCTGFKSDTEEPFKTKPVGILCTPDASTGRQSASEINSEVSVAHNDSSFSVDDKLDCCDELSVQYENGKLNKCPEGDECVQEDSRACEQQGFSEDKCCGNTPDTCNTGCKDKEKEDATNKKISEENFVSDVLIISDPEPIVPHATSISKDHQRIKSQPSTKKKKIHNQSKASSKGDSANPSNAVPSLNPDECTWDMLFDDNGDCLDPKLMEELTSAVGSVSIEKPKTSYKHYRPEINLPAGDDEFGHVVEIYNFPSDFKTQDLLAIFSQFKNGGFEIKWVDDTHALGVFSSPRVAADVLAYDHPFVKTRPLSDATPESRIKARRSAEFLQPYRPRPETCAALARRLVTGALGVRLATSREEREAERRQLREAREKKRLAARQQQDAWEGTIAEKQTSS